eukprot:1362697-Pyramimonas_sp.AAC.3
MGMHPYTLTLVSKQTRAAMFTDTPKGLESFTSRVVQNVAHHQEYANHHACGGCRVWVLAECRFSYMTR